MIIEQIIKNNLPEKIPKIVFFNNFSEDSYDIIANILINKINKNNNYEIVKIIKKLDTFLIKEINNKINDVNFFDEGKIFIIYDCPDLKSIKKIFLNKQHKNHYFFIFIKFKNFLLKEIRKYKIIENQKDLKISKIVNDFFSNKDILINNEVIDMFDNYFVEYNTELDSILEKIYLFLKENNLKYLDKNVAQQFLFLANQVVYFELSQLFFKKQIKKFFLLYQEFVLQQNSFEKFLYIFTNEVKTLIILNSLLKKNYSENRIVDIFRNIGINYNKYRLKYDLIKIKNFGNKKFKDLLSFLLYLDYSLRRYQKWNVQKIFEVKIMEYYK